MVKNGGVVRPAMVAAGYSVATAHTPQKLTESKGFQELLVEYGLTPDLIVSSLVEDIQAKPGRRTGELSLGADILGLKKKNDPLVAVQINFKDDKANYT